tara:strand:- start:10 stop:732 length:723 start_codon:yes stop_codon:yes gene_type:complete
MKIKQYSLSNLTAFFLLLLCNQIVLASTFLPDFNQYKNTQQKKKSFFAYLSPLAQKANKAVLLDRQRLLTLQQINKSEFNQKDTQWLSHIATRYRVKKQDIKSMLNALLMKVDAIPSALLLVQAANESAWGTSRFAKQGNNLFGQWCYRLHCGIVPLQRGKGKTNEVQTFNSPIDSINAYIFNLNSNNSYKALRVLRAKLHQQSKPISAIALAQGLLHYSERGAAYVHDIKTMIHNNNLE